LSATQKREQNAQAEDEIGRQKALQDHWDRQGRLRPVGKRHGMIKRTNKQIRNLRGTNVLFKTDGDNVKKFFLPNG
jgi:hypothetical protein